MARRSARAQTSVNYSHDETAHVEKMLVRIDGVGCCRRLRTGPVRSVVVGKGDGSLVVGNAVTGGGNPGVTLVSPFHHTGGELGQGGGDGEVRVRKFA